MKVVVSLGNSALVDPTLNKLSGELFRGMHNAAVSVHALLDAGHTVVLMFGHEHALDANPDYSLQIDNSVATEWDTSQVQRQGIVGYLLEQILRNTSKDKRHFATIMTHILVDAHDAAFAQDGDDSKAVCVGEVVDETTAHRWEKEKRWRMKRSGDGYQRAVPLPAPICVLQTESIKQLVASGKFTVLCSGAGVAVTRDLRQQESGVEALVDKDMAAAVLAHDIDADALLLLTDVLGVYEHWDTPEQHLLSILRLDEFDTDTFVGAGMKPKLDAAAWFAQTGGIAAIGPVGSTLDVLNGNSGTRLIA